MIYHITYIWFLLPLALDLPQSAHEAPLPQSRVPMHKAYWDMVLFTQLGISSITSQPCHNTQRVYIQKKMSNTVFGFFD